jgi:DNA-binding response OmpR family regulator
MKESNILIVEDESIVAMELESYIETLGYSVVGICSNSDDALKAIANNNINIIMMDICIKGNIDGIETAEIIKKHYPFIEIIFLTAHLDDYNVDRAIKIDPIAYLSKPFNREELHIFLKIAFHRIAQDTSIDSSSKHTIILDNDFSYNTLDNVLYCCNENINLTKKENELLKLLIENGNHIIDYYTIENSIWPDKPTNTNTIRTLVKRLRQKLKHKFIETISSRGYKLIISNKGTS